MRHPLSDQAVVSGKSAIFGGMMMQSRLRIDPWAADVREEIDAFRDRHPAGISLDLIFDQSGCRHHTDNPPDWIYGG